MEKPFFVGATMNLLVEIVGWTGALLVLGAYVGVSSGRMSGASVAFQVMNALGAAFFVLNTWWHGAIPSMVLNIVWSFIGLAALWRIARNRRGSAG
jgi:hypothetical protein